MPYESFIVHPAKLSPHYLIGFFPLFISSKKSSSGKYARGPAGAKGKHTYCPVYEIHLSPKQKAGILTAHYTIFGSLTLGFISCII